MPSVKKYRPEGKVRNKVTDILDHIKLSGKLDQRSFREIQELPMEPRVYLINKLGVYIKQYKSHHAINAFRKLPKEVQKKYLQYHDKKNKTKKV